MKPEMLSVLAVLPIMVLAEGATPRDTLRERNRAVVAAAYARNLKRFEAVPDTLVLPGLVADRQSKTVRISAESLGLDKSGSPPEFFLISQKSGHDYEALAVSFAKPSDVHKALVFIGMRRGRPVDPGSLRFWPKGERVIVTFACTNESRALSPTRVEELLIDSRTGKNLPGSGLVFTGSTTVASPVDATRTLYSADVHEPNSIAANYNEATSVLDVPRQAPQGAAYDRTSVNPELLLPKGSLIEVVMEPEYRDGKVRVKDLLLVVRGAGENGLAADVSAKDGRKLLEEGTIPGALALFTRLVEAGHDPFVTLSFSDALPVSHIRDVCRILTSIETENGIRVEPPRAGRLFYRAFLPPERFRDRATRIAQPWELRVSRRDGALAVRLTQVEEIWPEESDKLRPELKVHHVDIPTPEFLKKELDTRGPGLPVILAFCPPDLAYGVLLRFLAPVLPTHGTVHVFLDE